MTTHLLNTDRAKIKKIIKFSANYVKMDMIYTSKIVFKVVPKIVPNVQLLIRKIFASDAFRQIKEFN